MEAKQQLLFDVIVHDISTAICSLALIIIAKYNFVKKEKLNANHEYTWGSAEIC
jgi:hypothetical protein